MRRNPVHGKRRGYEAARGHRLGIAYVPEDRRKHGVILEMTVAANCTLASLQEFSRGGLLDFQRETPARPDSSSGLAIKTPSVLAPVGTLSGGNQQKVALSRWLVTKPAVLILDEPTQGVDVGSQGGDSQAHRRLARKGLAILIISSELPEILGMSDRIAVMRGGTIAEILERSRSHAGAYPVARAGSFVMIAKHPREWAVGLLFARVCCSRWRVAPPISTARPTCGTCC